MGTGGFRERLAGLRLITESVGYSHFGNNMQATRRPARAGELHKLDIRLAWLRGGLLQYTTSAHINHLLRETLGSKLGDCNAIQRV